MSAPYGAETIALPATRTVRPRDSLSKFAEAVRGDAGRWRDIYNLNLDLPFGLAADELARAFVPAWRENMGLLAAEPCINLAPGPWGEKR